MALGPSGVWDQISAIVNDYFMPDFPDLVFNKHPLLKMLWAKGTKPQGGNQIRQTFMYQFTKDGAYSDYDQLNSSGENQFDAAKFAWKKYYQHTAVSVPEINMCSGPEEVFGYLKKKMAGNAAGLRDSLATDMYVYTYNDDSIQINSLPNLLGDGTWPSTGYLTAGGINKSTYSWWRGFQRTETGTLGSRDTMTDLWFDIAEGTDVPDLIVSGYAPMKAHQAEVTITNAQERFTNTNQLLSGFTTITFQGCPWVADRHCTTTELYMLNTNTLDFVTHAKENARWDGWRTPSRQNVRVGYVFWMGNLCVSDPNMNGIIHKA